MLLAVIAAKQWALHQIDVSNAYLHGFLEEDIYLKPPPRYSKCPKGKLSQLIKSLYGLKKAGRQWHREISIKLLDFGFKRSLNDHRLFIKTDESGISTYMIIYVDDILISSQNEESILKVKKYLHQLFNIKGLGQVKYFLGVEIARSENDLVLTQEKYIADMLKDENFQHTKPTPSPLPTGTNQAVEGECFEDSELYRKIVGRMFYLYIIRPDISYATQ